MFVLTLLLEGAVFLGLNAPLLGFQGCIDPRIPKILVPQKLDPAKGFSWVFGFSVAFSQDLFLTSG